MSEARPQFIGEYEDVPIDPKGRLIVPAAFRKALPQGITSLIVAEWFEGCLAAFDPEGWTLLIQELRGLDRSQRQTRQLVRRLAGRAAEIKIDRQGRILLPKKLLDLGEISTHATLSGVIDKIEIWNPDRYNQAQDSADLESVAEELDWL
ncbi:MAG: MraZ protein [Candidatus Latescibacterota bacterium]|jgi:MraZ protein